MAWQNHIRYGTQNRFNGINIAHLVILVLLLIGSKETFHVDRLAIPYVFLQLVFKALVVAGHMFKITSNVKVQGNLPLKFEYNTKDNTCNTNTKSIYDDIYGKRERPVLLIVIDCLLGRILLG